MNNIEILSKHCLETFDFSTAKLSDEYYYNSLPFAVIDAIFSIGVRYASTKATVIRYCEYFNLQRIRTQKDFSPTIEQHTISQLISNISSIEHFSENILHNKQRTSSRNGILKAEAVLMWAELFQKNNIDTLQDFNQKYTKSLELDLKSIKGQSSGISLAYLKMLCGDDNHCKPDRHILQFISQCLSQDISPEMAQDYLNGVCDLLITKFPNLTVRLIDHTIWNYMSST